MRALVVEDNPLNMELMEAILVSQGWEIAKASTAEEAEFLLAAGDLPDMILLDIQLPGVDGMTLAKRIRTRDRFARIPLIAVTAHVMPGDAEKIREVGFDYYLPKPVQIGELVRLLRGQGGGGTGQ